VNELTVNTNGDRLTVMGTTTSLATNVAVYGTNAARYGDATFAATNMPFDDKPGNKKTFLKTITNGLSEIGITCIWPRATVEKPLR
jgi:hypothetical protein